MEEDRPAAVLSPFNELSVQELTAVRDFLLSQPELRLVKYDEAGPTDNVLFTVEMLPAAKADMLAHIDGGGPAPPRRAYAVLFLFDHADGAHCLQVEVGPLPAPTYYQPIRHNKQTPDIHIHSRPGSEPEYAGVDALMVEAFQTLDPIIAEVNGGYRYVDCGDKCLTWTDNAPRGIVRSLRKAWFSMMRKVEGQYLHPIGLEFFIDTSGTNSSQWYVDKIFYANRLWNTSQEIAAWYEANNHTTPGFKPWNPETEEDYRFSTFNPRIDTAPHRPPGGRPGPRQFEPAGKRYTVIGKHVNWMGWDLNLGMRSTAGMRLWDVRFNGTRVAYEISLQEASAAYGGDSASSPFQASTFYFDSSWGMGPSHLQLVPGSDCPDTATYFDFAHLWNGHDVRVNTNSACVFELDLGQPLRRHHQHHTRPKFAASMKSYALVVRSISTVYNYDYQWDHVFYTDGTIEVKVQAFGYLQTVRYAGNAYGYPISPDAGGTLHDHVCHWKVDLDVAGQSNSLLRSTIVPEVIEMPWHPTVQSTWGKRVQRTVAETEHNATLLINPNTPTYMTVVNEDKLNSHGHPRGYRIDHKTYTYSLIPDDAWIMQAASFMKYHVAVTARKEDEPTSTTIFDQATPKEPVVRFEDYIDGDSVRKQDLVAWVSAGTWHIPVSEDAPNTPSTAHAVGFVLRPFNYFDEDAALHTREVTIIRKDFSTGEAAVVDTGMVKARDCLPHAGLTAQEAADSFDSPTDDYDE
ncbi:hypothetical protein HYH02_011552 [Chlamydomonas schloesseri]|uniref:Amine oxidase n=1 Tax=Chlamydomonas schloesseri TaxID=2026947 RepID=A0A835W112_9CHLO|nr:hypothetical protein HYH02_011552 [Chlamydomonas schloesseri]|eukprot:KAG2436617.1 hypothetical protein HYH02_011552 [Chlamydomonas schloesseri]